jgi:hypothetical protein
MMRTIITGLAVMLCLSQPLHAKIWRVNNQLDADKSQGIFEQLAPLNSDPDVLPGDTVHLEGSPDTYSNFNCSKRLVILGPGYFLTENPETQARAIPARLGNVTFQSGSEGSIIMGVSFDITSNSGITIRTNNITVQRCFLRGGVSLDNITGARVIECYSLGSVRGVTSNTLYGDIIVRNNLFINASFNTHGGFFSICENNVFTGNSLAINASSFRNNILANTNANVEITSGNMSNNLASNGQFGTENGNKSVNLNGLFLEDGSTDGQWQLASNSPAKGAGTDGSDAGAFGGEGSYRLSGLPPIPLIYDLRVGDLGNLQTGVRVQVKAKSN